MFTHLKNIETAFQHIKRFSYLLIIANTLTTCFLGWKYYESLCKSEGKIHILYQGKLLEAFAAERKTNLPVELRDHIKTFHENFFNLIPNDHAIQKTIRNALYLADTSAKNQYDNLRETGYINNLIAANVTQQVEIDSIRLKGAGFPYDFTCFAVEKLTRSTNTAYRRLVTKGVIRDLGREDQFNPHGFLIEKWQIVTNKDTTLSNPIL